MPNPISTLALAAALALTTHPAAAPAQSSAQSSIQTAARAAPVAGSIASHPDWPAARAADVRSIDGIVNALYQVISGPAGQPREWQRFRSLFLPDARLIPTRPTPGTTHTDALLLSPEDYVARASRTMAAQGFFERPIHTEIDQFGAIAHVWSTYESRHAATDSVPFARGINSIQLLKDGDRYWIVEVLWDAETPTSRIPAAYRTSTELPGSRTAPNAPAIPGPNSLGPNAGFYGAWTGSREFHNGTSDAQTTLPARLLMTPSADGNAVTFAYTYQDGPGKPLREESVLSFAAAYNAATLTDPKTKAGETFQVQGLPEFMRRHIGTLILTGTTTESGKQLVVRLILNLERDSFRLRRETHPQAATDFRLRDLYSFTRVEPPSPAAAR